jgi:hypothetical protein
MSIFLLQDYYITTSTVELSELTLISFVPLVM